MPRYRVLVTRPDTGFMDIVVDADDEDEARRIACNMAWNEAVAPDDGTLLPVAVMVEPAPGPPTGPAPDPVLETGDEPLPLPDGTMVDETDGPRDNVVSLDAFRRRKTSP